METVTVDKSLQTNNDEVFTLTIDLGDLVRGLLLFLATLFSHFQAIGGGFIWDDDAHVTRLDLRSLGGLWDIWFKLGATQQYYPLLHSLFWFEHALWGDTAFFYHIANIFFHTIASLLVVVLIRKLSIPGAWVAGFIFALHPIHVESVAWITEQKNTVSGIFYLLSAIYYLNYDCDRKSKSYFYAFLLFILALLSKTVTATLPAALLLIFWWKRGKLSIKHDLVPLLPFFIIGAIAGLFTAWVERVYIGAVGPDFMLTPLMRCLLAGHVIWFYLGKLFWPANLIFIYEHWTIDSNSLLQYSYLIGVFILLGYLYYLMHKLSKNGNSGIVSRAPLASFLFYSGTLFPVLGFANVYPFQFSYVADHFQYLASLGVIVPVAALSTILVDKFSGEDKNIATLSGGVVIAILGFLSWNQCSIYLNAETLYTDTLNKNPMCWMAHNNLGAIWLNEGRVLEAKSQFEQALRIRPPYADAQSNLCSTLIRTGDYSGAVVHGIQAINLRPQSPENHNNLAIALAGLGRYQEAISQYKVALQLRPSYADVLNNIANAYVKIDKNQEAADAYQAAIKYAPNFPDAYGNLGMLLIKVGRSSDAIPFVEQAIRLNPNNILFHIYLGTALQNIGKLSDAINQYQEALKINPDISDAWYFIGNVYATLGRFADAEQPYNNALKLNPNNLGIENNLAAVCFKLGRIPEAISHYSAAIRLNPNYAEAHNNLGVALMAANLYSDAVVEFSKATKINPSYSDAYSNLGLALTNLNRFEEAIKTYKTAIQINKNNPDYHENLAKALKSWNHIIESESEFKIANALRSSIKDNIKK
jgi:protein O-mannosyl-transferase